jgi:hypothetical protein
VCVNLSVLGVVSTPPHWNTRVEFSSIPEESCSTAFAKVKDEQRGRKFMAKAVLSLQHGIVERYLV